jgi:hypothetical protein
VSPNGRVGAIDPKQPRTSGIGPGRTNRVTAAAGELARPPRLGRRGQPRRKEEIQ